MKIITNKPCLSRQLPLQFGPYHLRIGFARSFLHHLSKQEVGNPCLAGLVTRHLLRVFHPEPGSLAARSAIHPKPASSPRASTISAGPLPDWNISDSTSLPLAWLICPPRYDLRQFGQRLRPDLKFSDGQRAASDIAASFISEKRSPSIQLATVFGFTCRRSWPRSLLKVIGYSLVFSKAGRIIFSQPILFDEPMVLGIWQFRQLFLDFLHPLRFNYQRRQVRFREVAIIVCVLFAPLRVRLARGLRPSQRLLLYLPA